MNAHPEVPPGSERFVRLGNEWRFRVHVEGLATQYAVIGDVNWRDTQAAVAEVEWRRVHERLSAALFARLKPMQAMSEFERTIAMAWNAEEIAHAKPAIDAPAMAVAAWRAWGEG